MKRVFGYLQQNLNFAINFDVTEPDLSAYNVQTYDWFALYGNVTEEEPYGMPKPKGIPVITG
eukprot:14644911-Ditylum_brightwellii.AAC.1